MTTYRYDGDQQRRLRIRADGVTEYFVPGPGLVPLAEFTKAPNGALQIGREFIYAGDRLIASEGVVPPVPFSGDDPVVPGGTAPDKAHINELRWQANQIRQRYGLLPVNFGPAIVAGDEVAAAHLQAVRTAVTAIAAYAWPSDAAGQPLATGQPIRAAHVNELRDRIRALQGGASVRWFYHLDALGSVRAVTGATPAALIRRHEYGPFGEDLAPWPGADQRRFTGKERDPETGLDYFSARYYQNATGRFTSVDPLMGTDTALEDPQRWNRYSYVGNRPTRIIDPDGRGWASKLRKLVLKGGDVAATFADVAENAKILVASDSSMGARVVAGLSILTEAAPISAGDVKGIASFAMRRADDVPKLLGPGPRIGEKITDQMAGRGWTEELIGDTISNAVRTISTRDTRHLPGGKRMNDPATVYFRKGGGYLVRNNRTGDIVQISDRLDPNWRSPWD